MAESSSLIWYNRYETKPQTGASSHEGTETKAVHLNNTQCSSEKGISGKHNNLFTYLYFKSQFQPNTNNLNTTAVTLLIWVSLPVTWETVVQFPDRESYL